MTDRQQKIVVTILAFVVTVGSVGLAIYKGKPAESYKADASMTAPQ